MKTLQDWMNEYYPIDARTFVANLPEGMTKVEKDIALIKHALRKWKGAEEEALKEYRLVFRGAAIRSEEITFAFDTETCTLCVKYFDTDNETCAECPLNIARKARCDRYSAALDTAPPYYAAAMWESNPLPMIQFLEEVLADLEHQHEEMTRK